MFDRAVEREDRRAVFVEYAWDMGWCDPCAAEPLTQQGAGRARRALDRSDDDRRSGRGRRDAFVTRLHVRYDASAFPEDLALHGDARPREFPGPLRAAPSLARRRRIAAPASAIRRRWRRVSRAKPTRLADLTGWNPERIGARMSQTGQTIAVPASRQRRFHRAASCAAAAERAQAQAPATVMPSMRRVGASMPVLEFEIARRRSGAGTCP